MKAFMKENLSVELERKYEIFQDAEAPTKFQEANLTGGSSTTMQLRAVYYDTPELDLARVACAVRKRSGGIDDGWHLKQKIAGGSNEYSWGPAEKVPAEILDLVTEFTGVKKPELIPVANLNSERKQTELIDETGKLRCFFVDDLVSAFDRLENIGRAWREWEVELVEGPENVLQEIEASLLKAGAFVSPNHSKIARARGLTLKGSKRVNLSPESKMFLELSDVADQMQANADVPKGLTQRIRELSLAMLAKNS